MADSSSTSSSESIRWRGFAIRLALFVALVVVLDRGVGVGLATLYHRLDAGSFGPKITRVVNEQADLVVFGSSRAENHYIPELLSAATGYTAWNAGFGGQTILFHNGLLELVLARYTPQVIVLDLNVGDLTDPGKPTSWDKLSILAPYADNPAVHQLLLGRGKWERLKLWSAIYPYNGTLVSILKYTLSKRAGEDDARWRGFMPLTGSRMPELIDLAEKQGANAPPAGAPLGQLDFTWIERFLTRAQAAGARVVLVDSPRYHLHGYDYTDAEKEALVAYKAWLKQRNVAVLELTPRTRPELGDHRLFAETIHLNLDGAQLFSRALGEGLVRLGVQKKPAADAAVSATR